MLDQTQAKLRGVILLVLDGWGVNPSREGNAILQAQTPNFDSYVASYPHCLLSASGEEVGLTWGEIGNSEVGHYNIGSGRVVWQSLAKITNAIHDNSFFRNAVLIEVCKRAKKNGSRLHIVGLVSTGGVHSHLDHLLALTTLVKQNGSPKTCIHMITDGRDSAPKTALADLKVVESKIKSSHNIVIASVIGRYYAMDRDNRWKRTETAYNAMVMGESTDKAPSAREAIENAYDKELLDEFIPPTVITDREGNPQGTVNDDDVVIFFNFREDRMNQIVDAFYNDKFKNFKTKPINNLYLTSFVQYNKNFNFPIAFPLEKLSNTLPEMISSAGWAQVHIAETEKYAHVTYFFNGGKEEPVPNEKRILIPSPKVATYDKKPEMSTPEVAKEAGLAISSQKYQFVVINFANPDMVGHTGDITATIKAVEHCDQAIKTVVEAGIAAQYSILITADHGNAEEMFTKETGQVSKDHTANPVPVIFITPDNQNKLSDPSIIYEFTNSKPVGVLADIAPTILELLSTPKPKEMTGYSLLNLLANRKITKQK